MLLDTTITEELEAEGWANDVIRGLQEARKTQGFAVSDRITVTLSVPTDKEDWAKRHQETIAREVLAVKFTVVTNQQLASEVISAVTADIAKA